MKDLVRRVWYSITARMVVLFLLVGGCGFVLFLTLFRLYVASQTPPSPYPVPFLSYLVEQLQPTIEQTHIDSLMAQTMYELRIEGRNKNWHTEASIPALEQLTKIESLSSHAAYYRSSANARYLVIAKAGNHYIFGYRFNAQDDNAYQLVVLLIPLLASLLLMLGYFMADRFFIPINWVRKGAIRIGEGDLSYRIPYKRKDELGQLVDIVNKMAEDLERIFDSKRQLLLAISHELRSPLTRMKLNVALLDEGKISDRLSGDIDDMRDIVEGLLDSERLQGQHRALDKVQVEPIELIKAIVAEYSQACQVQFSHDEHIGAMALDMVKMKLLVRNLVNNAVKYTDPNERLIKVKLYHNEQQLVLSVADNGCGIADNHQGFIFSPFYRADQSRGRQTGGVGLGLYLCLLIVKAHDGQISVESRVNEGSCFTVTLPFAR